METDIAPLAKRLAEENNVDWRSLEGSGENGRVVERDVLNYLTRVMAGEADVDPTPEPLPEGVEAWVDEGGTPLERHADPERQAASAPDSDGAEDDADDELLLAGDDLEAGTPDRDAVGSADGTMRFDTYGSDAPAGGAMHLGDDARAPDLFVSDDDDDDRDPTKTETPELFERDEPRHDARPSGSGAGAGGRSTADPSDTFDFGGMPGERSEPEIPPVEASAGDLDASGASQADEDGGLSFDLDAGDDAQAPTAPSVEFDLDEPEGAMPEDLGPATPIGGPPESDVPTTEATATEAPTTEAGPVPSPAPAMTTRSEPSEAIANLPLARFRRVVRRHVDLGGLLALQRSAGLESGRGQVPVTAVLLLAARRAGSGIDVDAPGVALPGGSAGVRIVVPAGSALGDIAAEIAAVDAGGPAADDGADLWIADLSGLGIDEAILDSELPQLVLGRLLSDDEDGSLHGTLTLASDHDLEGAAAFLTRVAELIEDPLRMLA